MSGVAAAAVAAAAFRLLCFAAARLVGCVFLLLVRLAANAGMPQALLTNYYAAGDAGCTLQNASVK